MGKAFMAQKQLKFLLGDHETKFVAAVDDEHDAIGSLVIVLPQGTIPSLTWHVENCEIDVVVLELFSGETNRWHDVDDLNIFWF